MKRITLIFSLLVALAVTAGARGINFSITLTDETGMLQADTDATLRLSLIADDVNGEAKYVETQNVKSNAYGVVHTVFGEGTSVGGDWNAIDWNNDALYLKVERNVNGTYELLNTMRLGAVPYAYHAKTAEGLSLKSPDGTAWNVGVDNKGNLVTSKAAPSDAPKYGTVDYIFDINALPTITIEITTDEWNTLLHNYDLNSQNEECVHANFYFSKYGRVDRLEDIGLRLRGNTSRVRPEGSYGQEHQVNGDFHHIHFGFRFQKFQKGDENLLSGTDRFNLRWAKGDPTYVHEVYGYDLMRRFGVYTTAKSSYCMVYLKFVEEEEPVYLGVSEMFECYDEQYLADHTANGDFAGATGFMWKGSWGSGIPANFSSADRWAMGIENVTLNPDESESYSYDYKSKKKKLEEAKDQLMDFITKVNTLNGDEFKTWAESAIDIDLFLRAMACEYAIGHWDDFWGNGNNYYIYFDNDGDKKMRYIPYDLDNTLGTTWGNYDSGTQSPYQWGACPLANKVLGVTEWNNKFLSYLDQLIDPANDYFDAAKSKVRIQKWWSLINGHTQNATWEDCSIQDTPASWSNNRSYRVANDENNYFTVKANTIRNLRK